MSSDFNELLAEFNAHGVEFIVVGAHALAAHGRIHATKDLDIWIRPSRENAPRAWADRVTTTFQGEPVAVLSRDILIRNKKAVGRVQDLADAEWLEKNTP